jgi:hypothetical protein
MEQPPSVRPQAKARQGRHSAAHGSVVSSLLAASPTGAHLGEVAVGAPGCKPELGARLRACTAAGSSSKLLLSPPFFPLDYIEFMGAKKHLVTDVLSNAGSADESNCSGSTG